MVNVQTYLNPTQFAILKRVAEKNGITVHALVKQFVLRALANPYSNIENIGTSKVPHRHRRHKTKSWKA